MRIIEHAIQPFRPLNAVKLGRFIVSKEEPQQGFQDPDLHHPHEPLITVQRDLGQTAGKKSSTSYKVGTSQIAGYTDVRDARDTQSLTATTARIYQLNNSDLWFEMAIQEAKTREWMGKAITSTGRIYLIVGYKTVQNAAMEYERSNLQEKDGSVHAPVAVSVATAAPIPVARGEADPGLKLRHVRESYAHQSLAAPGEQVAQLQLRKLKFKLFSSRHLEGVKLEGKARWRCGSKVRGVASDVNDVMDVKLEESDDSDSESDSN